MVIVQRNHAAYLDGGLILHQQEPAPDRSRPRQHLDGRSRGVGLGGTVTFGKGCHERLDAVQGRPPGFQQRPEREHGGGGPVPEDGVADGLGAGETPFHQDVEGARDLLDTPGRLARERGGFTVGPVDEEPVHGVLQRLQTEEREQGGLCRIRRDGGAVRRARAVGAQCRPSTQWRRETPDARNGHTQRHQSAPVPAAPPATVPAPLSSYRRRPVITLSG
ncbi:hypothetical protein GCM10018966_104040 [Streptomyces yanii]